MNRISGFDFAGLPVRQILRYGIVGVASNLTGYLVYLTITYFGLEPKVAMTFLYGVGATVGFFGNRNWAFAHDGNFWRAAARYTVAHAFGYLLNLTILFMFVDKFGYKHQIVQGIAIFVVAGYLFLAFKFFVFRTTTTK